MSEEINQNRRRLSGIAAASVAVTGSAHAQGSQLKPSGLPTINRARTRHSMCRSRSMQAC